MNKKQIPDDVMIAREAVAQMFGASKTDMTEVEVNLWRNEIDRLGANNVLRFVRYWIGGGGQGSFLRAPRIDDLLRLMDPNFLSPEDALEMLRKQVAEVGPYRNPSISNGKLHVAVAALGGWAKVCEDMPDAGEEFKSKRFADRFKSAWAQGESAVLRGLPPPAPLLGLVSAPHQLAISPPDDVSESPPMIAAASFQ